MGKIYSIRDRAHSNTIYTLISRINVHDIRDRRPYLFRRFVKMARTMEVSLQNDDRLKGLVRKALPADLSATLVPAAEALVTKSGQALRDELYQLFSDEIESALERDRAQR